MNASTRCVDCGVQLEPDEAESATADAMFTTIDLLNGGAALLDASDLDLVSGYRWRSFTINGHSYARAYADNKMYLMHRLILGVTDPLVEVDHVNFDGLDNRRCNIRLASRSENLCHRHKHRPGCSSRFKGVYFDKRSLLKPWQGYINVSGVRNFLGYFETEEEAARAYDAAAKVAHGEFAVLNFPLERSARLLKAAHSHLTSAGETLSTLRRERAAK